MISADLPNILALLEPDQREIVDALRRAVMSAAHNPSESVLWGSLSYHRPEVGGRVKGAICLISVKRGKVLLEFIHGVRLPDPHGLLKGSAASKRYVEISSLEQAARPEIVDLIRSASQVEWK